MTRSRFIAKEPRKDTWVLISNEMETKIILLQEGLAKPIIAALGLDSK
jgi:hypothetical protein